MIEFRNLSKKYGNHIIFSNFNERIETGEFVFLVGTSGSGKSTLFKMLIKADFPDKGQVLIDNYDLAKVKDSQLPMLRRQVAVIFQDFKLIPNKTVAENLAFALDVQNIKLDKEKRINELLDLVRLQHRRSAIPRELSGGEKQRVAIARAMSTDPKILLADEPTGNLDPTTTWEIVRLLDDINKTGTTVIMATHDAEIVNTLNTRIIFLDSEDHPSFNNLTKSENQESIYEVYKIDNIEKPQLKVNNSTQTDHRTNSNLDQSVQTLQNNSSQIKKENSFDFFSLQAKIKQSSLRFDQNVLNSTEVETQKEENSSLKSTSKPTNVNEAKMNGNNIIHKIEKENLSAPNFVNPTLKRNEVESKRNNTQTEFKESKKEINNNSRVENSISKKTASATKQEKPIHPKATDSNKTIVKTKKIATENIQNKSETKFGKKNLEREMKLADKNVQNESIFTKFKSLFSTHKAKSNINFDNKNVATVNSSNQGVKPNQPQMKFSFSLINTMNQDDNIDELEILDIPADIKRTLKQARIRRIKDLKMMSDFELNKLVGSFNSWKVKKAIEKVKV